MKNNILAIIVAAGTAVVGSSLFSAPARALTVDQDVNVEITVPEVLYLRTFDTISLDITGDDLAGGTGIITAGVGKDNSAGAITTGTTLIDQSSPFGGVTVASIQKTVDELYAVWSNNPDGFTVNVTTDNDTLTSSSGAATAVITSVTKDDTDPTAAVGLSTPFVGGVTLDLDLTNATEADTYDGGVINVEVVSP